MNTANHSTIKFRHETQNEFKVDYENSFLVLPDGKTIVGVDGSDLKKLMIEDITRGNPSQIGTHDDWIQIVLFNSLTQSLLVWDFDGHVKQYKKVKGSFTMVKDYGNVGVGEVLSSTIVGRFAIFGGNNHSLFVIDIYEQEVCKERLKSPFECTTSLQVCESMDSNVYLSFGGKRPEYSSDRSDWLDVTLLYKGYIPLNQFYEIINQARTFFKEKDEMVNFLNLKIKQLESSLQKQADQNQGTSNKKTSKTKTSP